MGAFKSIILSVLGLLTPQDLKKLTEASRQRAPALKQAAGGETLLWEDDVPVPAQKEARVLEFPKRHEEQQQRPANEFIAQSNPLEAIGVMSAEKQAEMRKAAEEAYEKTKPDSLDLMLTERERFRDSEDRIYKQNGLASYRKNSDLRLYRVTVTDQQGKEKTRITSTLGVLVDKKQA